MDTIFVIDDEEAVCLTLKKILEAEGYSILWATDPNPLLSNLPQNRVSCVLLDLNLGGINGMECIVKIRGVDPHLPIIMITAFETVKTAVEAMKRGVFHYLAKPFDNYELKALVAHAVSIRHLYWKVEDFEKKALTGCLEESMGHSAPIQMLMRHCHAVAEARVNILLSGETGTGKELVARYIHDLNGDHKKPFIIVDCASIPESLFESELFGHEKGTFTGAYALHKGKLEQANGGTLLLDEVQNIPLNIQAKLLRFLETFTFERLGAGRSITVSLRLLAATNKNLRECIQAGGFREDLFHRLNEFPIQIPTLQERLEDIPYLAMKFIREFESQIGKTFSGISAEALEILECYAWPGNVRELRNVIKRAMVMATEKIEVADLPRDFKQSIPIEQGQNIIIPIKTNLSLKEAVKEVVSLVEKQLIQNALQQTRGRKGQAGQLLGIDEKTLYNKLRVYKI